MVGGAFLEEEKVEQEVFGGLQAPSCEKLNPALEQEAPMYIDHIELLT
jgi:hypothetical protein